MAGGVGPIFRGGCPSMQLLQYENWNVQVGLKVPLPREGPVEWMVVLIDRCGTRSFRCCICGVVGIR